MRGVKLGLVGGGILLACSSSTRTFSDETGGGGGGDAVSGGGGRAGAAGAKNSGGASSTKGGASGTSSGGSAASGGSVGFGGVAGGPDGSGGTVNGSGGESIGGSEPGGGSSSGGLGAAGANAGGGRGGSGTGGLGLGGTNTSMGGKSTGAGGTSTGTGGKSTATGGKSTGGTGAGGTSTGTGGKSTGTGGGTACNGKLCGSRCVPANGCCDNTGCTAPQTCGGGTTPDVCGCTRTTTCTGKCGDIVDNCGATLSCGTSACLTGQTCNSSNACTCGGRQCTSICCAPPPTGTTSVCLASGTQCGLQCNPGTHSCSSTEPPCYSDTDVANCGVEGGPCLDCRQPNTNSACGTGAKCANTCLLNQVHLTACAEPLGKPNCSQWQFESGTTENWVVGTNGDSQVGQVVSSSAQHYSGNGSLSLRLQTPSGQTYGSAYMKVLLCVGKEAVSAAGKTISGNIRFEPPPSGNTTMSVEYFLDSSLTNARIPEQNPRVDSTSGWIGFNIPFPDSSGVVAGIGVGINFNNGAYNGTVYLDDVMMQ